MEWDFVRIHARLQVCRPKREKCRRSCGGPLRPPAQFEVRLAILPASCHEEVARSDANNLGAEHHPTPRRCLCERISIDVRSCANMPLPPPRSHVKRNSNSGQHRRSGAID